jgi:hypothetical protein
MDPTALPSQAHDAGPMRHHVISKARRPNELSSYFLPDTDLEMGASLGNTCCWVTTKGTGDIESVLSTSLGKTVVGAICLRYSGVGHRIIRPDHHEAAPLISQAYDRGEDGVRSVSMTAVGKEVSPPGVSEKAEHYALHEGASTAFVHLRQETPGEFELHPAYQRHRYELPGHLEVEETVFVPHVAAPAQAKGHADLEAPLVYQIVTLHNCAPLTRRIRISGFARLHGATPADITAVYDPILRQGALVAKNVSHPDWVRIFGIAGQDVQVSAWETTFDASQVYETTHVFPLDNDTSAAGDVLGALQVEVDLKPGERVEFAFITAFSSAGEGQARQTFDCAWNYERALRQTMHYYTEAVGVTEILTPDPLINQGVIWAKVNMLRVMSDYPTGPAFTNDPSHSSAVVGRDAAWFIYGCDHLLPQFSRHLLDAFAQRQKPSTTPMGTMA